VLLRKLIGTRPLSVSAEAPLKAAMLAPSGGAEADEQLQLFLAQPSRSLLSPETKAAAYRTLAEALLTQGRYEEASELLADALSSEHPERWRTLATHGRVLALQGRLDQAEATLREALALAQKHAGKHHIDTGRILAELARIEHRLGRSEASNTALRAMEIYSSAQIAEAEKTAARSDLTPIAART
jgi:tetratricopeptide (TPR) repeat protein